METFLMWSWPSELEPYVGHFVFWSGYAILIALVARFVIHPRALRSPWLTYCMGMLSVTIATFLIRAFIAPDKEISPLSPPCLLASTLVAIAVNAMWLFVSFLARGGDVDEYDEEEYDSEYDETDDGRDGWDGRDGRAYDRDGRERDFRDDRDRRNDRNYREGERSGRRRYRN